QHPEWHVAAQHLDSVLKELGQDNGQGRREGEAHLTLSRAGLINGFPDYFTHGSEFDYHAAHRLLGDDGVALLARDGVARIIQFAVPGQEALKAAHPRSSIEDLRSRRQVPNIAREVLEAWSYRAAHPTFDPQINLRVDCGMVFLSAVPADWITNIETLA